MSAHLQRHDQPARNGYYSYVGYAMRQTILDFLRLSPVFIVPALVIAIRQYGKLSPELKVITYYLFLSALTEILAAVLAQIKVHNLPLLHVYTIVQFILIARFYGIVLSGFIPPRLTRWCMYFFIAFSLVNSLFFQTIHTNNTYARTLESLLAITFSLTLFYRIISEMRIERLENSAIFWINAAFLIYFSSTIFLFVMSNFILPLNTTLNIYLWGLHAVISTFHYILISIGLWKHPT